MATLLSHPVNLIVKAPVSPDASFGSGGDAGHMKGDVWHPGRDDGGKVNARSWDIVPRRRWVIVAGTQLAALDAQVRAAVPGWTTTSLAWHKLFQSWSGFALDMDGSRLWFLGGGHSDGHNNGLYRFDLFRMRWAVEEMPSDRTVWASDYSPLSATSYPPSRAAAEAKLAAGRLAPVNDLYWDELPDGKPTARHTYSGLVYVPDTQEVVMTARRLWRYSLNHKRWGYKRLIRDEFHLWMDAENVIATYDEATGEVLFSSTGSQARYRSTGYDLMRNVWTDWSAPWRRYSGCADVRHGRMLTIFEPPELGAAGYKSSPGRYWHYDLDKRATAVGGEVQFAPGLAIEDFPLNTSFYDGSSITYVASEGEYWVCTRRADKTMAFFALDPRTTPWTMRPLTFEGAVPVPGRLPKRRMNYWPALNAVTFADHGNRDLYLYRL